MLGGRTLAKKACASSIPGTRRMLHQPTYMQEENPASFWFKHLARGVIFAVSLERRDLVLMVESSFDLQTGGWRQLIVVSSVCSWRPTCQYRSAPYPKGSAFAKS